MALGRPAASTADVLAKDFLYRASSLSCVSVALQGGSERERSRSDGVRSGDSSPPFQTQPGAVVRTLVGPGCRSSCSPAGRPRGAGWPRRAVAGPLRLAAAYPPPWPRQPRARWPPASPALGSSRSRGQVVSSALQRGLRRRPLAPLRCRLRRPLRRLRRPLRRPRLRRLSLRRPNVHVIGHYAAGHASFCLH